MSWGSLDSPSSCLEGTYSLIRIRYKEDINWVLRDKICDRAGLVVVYACNPSTLRPRLRENQEFKYIPTYIVSVKSTWAT